jgi:uncharacterized 2Fe-2S/4Fe-4S cluster protein (DUF4445 family)
MTPGQRIIFEPAGRRLDMPAGRTILAAAQEAGLGLIAVCDGRGTCHQCIIQLISGELTPPTDIERKLFSQSKLESGLRLACQAVPVSDVTIDLPPESISTNQRLQVEGIETVLVLDPVIKAVDLTLEPSTRKDPFLDQQELRQALIARYPAVDITTQVLEQFPAVWNEKKRQLRLAIHKTGRVAGILSPGQGIYGLALDIGTTKLAAYLVDLESGQIIARQGASNPQIAYGEDVISRIAYANQGTTETHRLQKALVEAINAMLAEICRVNKVESHQIVDAVAVGNTAMHHLFTGLPTRQLGEAPYLPAQREALDLPAVTLGLSLSPGALVHLPPVIAGFVGSDHVAADLACGLIDAGENTLLIDIGTNTEITLRTPSGLSCCSCASGPAFEGAHIHAGMRAAPGAIERIFYDQGGWRFQTIDGKAPVGLCGSGILDAVAEMHRAGIIDERGTLRKTATGVERLAQGWAFRLTDAAPDSRLEGIHVTRRDVNEIQLAKAAIRAGIEVLLKESDLRADQVTRIIVAGAFGTYLHLSSALEIGMFPDIPEDRFSQVGNAAGAGARMMLVSDQHRREAIALQSRIRYIELTTFSEFQEIYLAALPVTARLAFPGSQGVYAKISGIQFG